jgi:hypothetical protein
MLCLPVCFLCSSFNSFLLLFSLVPCSFSHILLLICWPACPFPTPTLYSSASLYFANLNVPCTTCPFSWPSNVSKPATSTWCMLLCFIVPSAGFRSFACLPASCCFYKELPCLPACYIYSFCSLYRSSSSAVKHCCVLQWGTYTILVHIREP